MSQEKCYSWLKYFVARLKRLPILLLLWPLIRWSRGSLKEEGFTIVVACHARLPEVLIASFKLLARQKMDELCETIITFDSIKTQELINVEIRMINEFPALKIRCFYQNRLQSIISKAISWGWVDCWMSYCSGISEATTRTVMLHDMDAMILLPGLIAERLKIFKENRFDFAGYHWYVGNGLVEEDEVLYIVEMFLDVGFIKNHFKPIDLFNKITRYKGRRIDFDTMLYPQIFSKRKSMIPILGYEMVHPGQVISQYTYLYNNRSYVPPAQNNLFFIPYFYFISGDDRSLKEFTSQMINMNYDDNSIPFFDLQMNIRCLTAEHLRWIIKQILILEYSIYGNVRTVVHDYLDAIRQRCLEKPSLSIFESVRLELKFDKA